MSATCNHTSFKEGCRPCEAERDYFAEQDAITATCAHCDFAIAFRNGGFVHVAPKELIDGAQSALTIEQRVNAFLHLTRDHAAEPTRGA